MVVGTHRITGTVERLPKPVIIVGRAADAPAGGGDDGGAGAGAGGWAGGGDDDDGPAPPPEYIVKAVVRWRVLFTDRPQPIIGSGAGRRV
jgi:hypothetical protein